MFLMMRTGGQQDYGVFYEKSKGRVLVFFVESCHGLNLSCNVCIIKRLHFIWKIDDEKESFWEASNGNLVWN